MLKKTTDRAISANTIRILTVLIAAAAGLVLGLGLVQCFLRHVGHDQSWNLYAADQLLRGTKLNGPELVEVNPPLIIWIACVPVLLGRILHIGMLNGFRICFDLIALLSIIWSAILFRRLYRPNPFCLWLLITTESIISFWLIRRDAIGQREHFLVLFLIPYLILAGRRLESGRQSTRDVGLAHGVFIGLSAALAICLKPQHIFDVCVVEAVVFLRLRSIQKWLDVSLFSLVTGMALYVASVECFNRAYLVDMIPLIRLTYWGFDISYWSIFRIGSNVILASLATAVVFGILLLRRSIRFWSVTAVLVCASLSADVVFFQQHKGWTYQLIPVGLFTGYVIAFLLMGLLERWLVSKTPSHVWKRNLPTGLAVLCAILSCSLGVKLAKKQDYYDPRKRVLAEFFANYPAGTPIAFLSTQAVAFPIVVEQNKVLASRFLSFWMLPAILRAQDGDAKVRKNLSKQEIAYLSTLQRQETTEDLHRWQPIAVVVDENDPAISHALHREHFKDILEWFTKDSAFQAEWQKYRYVKTLGQLALFERSSKD